MPSKSGLSVVKSLRELIMMAALPPILSYPYKGNQLSASPIRKVRIGG